MKEIDLPHQADDYKRVERAINYIEQNFKQQPTLGQIAYGFSQCLFGEAMIATTQRGICCISFLEKEHRSQMINQLYSTWPRAEFTENQDHIHAIAHQIFGMRNADTSRPLRLHVKGTNFQVNVWQALLAIPSGRLVSYHDIATSLGKPRAARAVAPAVTGNPVAYMIPCHRVIAKTGKFHKYRWGATRKKAMIAWEAAANM